MMKNLFFFIFIISILYSCELEGVKKNIGITPQLSVNDTLVAKPKKKSPEEFKDSIENILPESIETEKILDNGIKIKWFKHGVGEKIKPFDVIEIDYRVKLTDGKVYDGNHLIKKSSIAFPTGWNQQTKGWALALKELNIGDEVEIFLPAKFARGEKGIPGIVPSDADNILELRILNKVEPVKEIDGTKVYLIERSKKHDAKVTDTSTIGISYFVSTPTKPRYDNSYQRGKPFTLTMGDGNIVPGLYKALQGMKMMDKLYIHIPSKEAYGKKGLKPNVEPNQDIFYDIIISEVD